MLKLSLALRLEIGILVTEKGKVVAELSDGKWLWDLLLLFDMIHQLSNITKPQGQKSISHTFGKQYENVNMCHFLL
jgi:hypothetical protein